VITELQAALISAEVAKHVRPPGTAERGDDRPVCGHTMRHAQAACKKLDVAWEDAEDRLTRGGPCDCELLMNATDWGFVRSLRIAGRI